MHIYEPRPKRARVKNKYPRRLATVSIFIIVLLGGFITYKQFLQKNASGILGDTNQNGTSSTSTGGTFTYLNGYDFQKIYEESALPNTKKVFELPPITGNDAVDARIRQIAESRGYKLQPVPKQELVTAAEQVENNKLQPLASEAWIRLKQSALGDKVQLGFFSGHSSIESEKELFLSRMAANGLRTNQIEAGQADSALIDLISSVVPPGYSRQQTGYAIEVSCPGESGKAFEFTACNKWLKNNNYAKARQAGFVPSQADGVGIASTNPMTAEYVWVGTSRVY